MSVSLRSSKEMAIITAGLIYHYDLYNDLIGESKVYTASKSRHGEYFDEADGKFDHIFICWLMFRLWIANKVAYSVQYGDTLNFQEELSGIAPVEVDIRVLSSEMRSLNYNIYTNGGQYWLDHEWYELYLKIMNRIREKSEERVGGRIR